MSKLSPSAILVAVALMMLGVTIWEHPWRPASTASQINALFEAPVPILWNGVITRSLAGGRGLEIQGAQAPGGYFFVYWDDDRISPITQGAVQVSGEWLGTSCEYGRCAPQIRATNVVSSTP